MGQRRGGKRTAAAAASQRRGDARCQSAPSARFVAVCERWRPDDDGDDGRRRAAVRHGGGHRARVYAARVRRSGGNATLVRGDSALHSGARAVGPRDGRWRQQCDAVGAAGQRTGWVSAAVDETAIAVRSGADYG